ncbi:MULTISPECIES: phosphate ABC transporter permease subunit PstC [unclassified Gordonia (in: high G+C Gram-positive bacteria)]|uniref:phosphate ABC transporter permease subunit PstC n=1 Tax=unclassified Gordonia (in: high G+C Gram-positive bacteria) TaxID=2657482 RepID=UPI001F0D311D|nr:phosphate ABC transporter permease subunit PstC [Gordonia sp. ABSL49_1]MCH5644958.1 phosphate ABC transporter permease subunit PstC [Gordonia sp. ABSL49_1]
MTSISKEEGALPPPGDGSDSPVPTPDDKQPGGLHAAAHHRLADQIFRSLAVGSGFVVSIVIGLIAIFLIAQAAPSLAKNSENFFTYSGPWVTSGSELAFGIPQLFYATMVVSIIALLIAMPVALAISIFLTEYAPKRLIGPVTYTVDLLAAVPSIVYGLWGILVLGPALVPVNNWLVANLGFLPFFQEPTQVANMSTGGTLLTAGIVLAVMILPIITAVTREVFMQTPKGHREAALALGATKFEVVKLAVMPFGFSGYISGSMLGLGRALGETMALLLIISTVGPMDFNLMESGETFATKIANNAAEFDSPAKTGAYISAGLTLFVLTFIVNAAARAVITGKKK